jgi:hypothetical protein
LPRSRSKPVWRSSSISTRRPSYTVISREPMRRRDRRRF